LTEGILGAREQTVAVGAGDPEMKAEVEAATAATTVTMTTELADTVEAAPQQLSTAPKAVKGSQYEFLRPENTFGESSPFKRSPKRKGRENGKGRVNEKLEGNGEEKEKVEEQELEGWEWEKQRYRVPGAFDF
jgi:hypothetical protein